jgi:parvulin-like peptidyl-prolyl isomerase
MKKSLVLAVLLALIAVVLAGCGGGGSSSSVPSAAKLASGDVAVVGKTHITQKAFDTLMESGKQTLKQQGQKFPKQGTTEYETIKGQAVTALVQQAELNDKAASMGIEVTDKQVQNRLDAIKKQYYQGSTKKYLAAVKAQHVTDADVRTDIRNQLIDQALFARVTKDIKVSDKKINQYYQANPTQFPTAAKSRKVRHILVKKKTLADSIYSQLKAGNDKTWCTLAKKYSQDPSSKDKCGVLTVTKGETVPVFDKVAFSEKTGVVHKPVYDSDQYKSYFVIEPIADVKPGNTKPSKSERSQIITSLTTSRKNKVMSDWVRNLEKSYCSGTHVRYQTGYAPTPDPCDTLTSTSSTTTTG